MNVFCKYILKLRNHNNWFLNSIIRLQLSFMCHINKSVIDNTNLLLYYRQMFCLSFHWSDVSHMVANTDKWFISLMGNERHELFEDFQHSNGVHLARDVYYLHAMNGLIRSRHVNHNFPNNLLAFPIYFMEICISS